MERTAAPRSPSPVTLLAASLASLCIAGSTLATPPTLPSLLTDRNEGNVGTWAHQQCARQFDRAQRMDMESFRDYDADVFRAVHDDRAITVFSSGAIFNGIDKIMAALQGHFSNREAQWTWTEKHRVIDGCNSAFILYETVYAIPRIGYRQRALTGVSYSYDRGRWLSIADQSTPLPPAP